MVFYLVLRALDTIEDDMTAFSSTKTKITHLQNFSRTALADPEWRMMGVGEADEKRLLEEFPKCHSVFMGLGEGSRKVIVDIAERMAGGMAEFVEKDLGEGEQIKRYKNISYSTI
jgi:farnesyl-diphosphate farnesyltransferase|tara:strand:- start:322 stop:666 length:345 start_codon:yes stop_codon:yes gene_type:complete